MSSPSLSRTGPDRGDARPSAGVAGVREEPPRRRTARRPRSSPPSPGPPGPGSAAKWAGPTPPPVTPPRARSQRRLAHPAARVRPADRRGGGPHDLARRPLRHAAQIGTNDHLRAVVRADRQGGPDGGGTVAAVGAGVSGTGGRARTSFDAVGAGRAGLRRGARPAGHRAAAGRAERGPRSGPACGMPTRPLRPRHGPRRHHLRPVLGLPGSAAGGRDRTKSGSRTSSPPWPASRSRTPKASSSSSSSTPRWRSGSSTGPPRSRKRAEQLAASNEELARVASKLREAEGPNSSPRPTPPRTPTGPRAGSWPR